MSDLQPHPPTAPVPGPEQGQRPLDDLDDLLEPVRRYLRTEVLGGLLLLIASIAALIWANSGAADLYETFTNMYVSIKMGEVEVKHSVQHWVNDGLMTLFFFLIGLEIKRELTTGRLRSPAAAALPATAAVGGMVVPAGVYLLLTAGGPAQHGWAVPMATDIAFVVGLIGLLGRRVPADLRLFLLTLAIVDDIGAIVVIALFYSDGINVGYLGAVAALPVVLLFMRWLGVRSILPYILVGIVAWACTFKSGIHATIAGVILGVMTPAHPVGERKILEEIEHDLHPWVAFLVVPLFAFVNAGVPLDIGHLGDALDRQVTTATAAGLVVGKTVGVIVFAAVGVAFGMRLPQGVTFKHIAAAAPLTGVGFTVSLILAALSFTDPARSAAAKIGILGGSLVCAVLGLVLLLWVSRGRTSDSPTTTGGLVPQEE